MLQIPKTLVNLPSKASLHVSQKRKDAVIGAAGRAVANQPQIPVI
ncbi:hypothetical protein [Cupriavidus sp. TMH.W2]